MAGKKYTGPERRGKEPTRRNVETEYAVGRHVRGADSTGIMATGERRLARDFRPGRIRSMPIMNVPVESTTNTNSPHGPLASTYGIVDIKEPEIHPERRMHGAGRRAGDLGRALETGESAIFQIGKGVMANAGKLAKKVISKKLKLGP